MLIWLSNQLSAAGAGVPFEVWEKITFRASLAAMASFVMAVILGPRLIAWLNRRFREPNKSDSAEIRRLHGDKESTPTMGGLFIMAGLIVGVLVFGRLENPYLQAALVVAIGLAALGAVDDLVKLRGDSNGISARRKLLGQVLVASVGAVMLYNQQATLDDGLMLRLPLLQGGISLGIWFVPLAVLVIVGSSNAVNLSDGLDGLAGGCLIFAIAAMTAMTYAGGHAELAAYLNVPRIPGAGETTVLAGAMIGGLMGFLWFNCHPAQVFMGDTGALPLGGLLGVLALVARQEILLLVVGGVFVAEALSVIIQVGYFKWRRRRVFLCAPLHHHFQFKGWPENKIVVRFWIAAALCGLLGMAGIKLGAADPVPPNHVSTTAVETRIQR
jgi:phospho-N-acetylmuramoyl-pentapeptide-transferase